MIDPNAANLSRLMPLLGFIFLLFCAIIAAWGGMLLRLSLGYPLLRQAKPRIVSWGIGSIVLVFVLYLSLSALVGRAFLSVSRSKPQQAAAPAPAKAAINEKAAKPVHARELTPYEQLVIMSLLNLAFVPLVPVCLRLTSGADLDQLGLNVSGLPLNVFRGVVACLLIQPVAYAVMLPLSRYQTPHPHPIMELLRDNASSFNVMLALAGAILLAPAAEELFFRGILMPWLSKLFFRPGSLNDSAPNPTAAEARFEQTPHDTFTAEDVVDAPPRSITEATPVPASRHARADLLANILTSFVFAGLHFQQWPAPIPLFLLSMVLGFLYQRTGSLWAPLTLHACFNSVSTIMLVLLVRSGVPLPKTAAPPVGVSIHAPERMHEVAPGNILGFLKELHLSDAQRAGNILYPSRRDFRSNAVLAVPLTRQTNDGLSLEGCWSSEIE